MKEKVLYNILLPILYVKDLESEKQFYLDLGFEISYEGKEYPSFVGIKYKDTIEFGLEKKDEIDVKLLNRMFTWQIGTNSLKEIRTLSIQYGYKVISEPEVVMEEWNLYSMCIESSNGYEVVFEGPLDYKNE